jgi:hypothetical protein
MASHTQPSAINIALIGWRDALRAITRMMPVAGPAFLLALMPQAVDQLLRGHSFAVDLAISPVFGIVQGLVLTPLGIAVHRYVLLGEVTPHYALNPADRRFQWFFGVVLAVQALWTCIAIWLILGHFFGLPLLFVCLTAALVTGIVVVNVMLSIVILFPAVAIDAPGVGWRNAMDDSRGHAVRTFWAFALGLVPMFALDEVADLILGPREFGFGPHPAFQIIHVVLQAAESVLTVSAYAAIASTLYLALGSRLKGSAPVACRCRSRSGSSSTTYAAITRLRPSCFAR